MIISTLDTIFQTYKSCAYIFKMFFYTVTETKDRNALLSSVQREIISDVASPDSTSREQNSKTWPSCKRCERCLHLSRVSLHVFNFNFFVSFFIFFLSFLLPSLFCHHILIS